MKYFPGFLVAILLLVSWPALAQEIDDQYLHIMRLAEQADSLKAGGKNDAALAKYREAQRALQTFQKSYPRWNMNVVSFRMSDLSQNIASLSGAPTSSSKPVQTTAGTSGSNSEVKLMAPGAEPRKALRLHLKAEDKQTMQMEIKMHLDMKLGDVFDQAIKLPTIQMNMEMLVKSVAPNGDISYEFRMLEGTIVEDPEVLPQVSEGMKGSLEKMKGLTGTGTMSSRGVNKAIDYKAPEDADPQTRQAVDQMKQSFSNMSVPFPAEPVGIGAKWETKVPIQSQGVKLDQTVVYEIVSIEGDIVKTKSTITQTAGKQEIQSPVMPQMKFDLDKMEGHGTGESTIDLSKPVPDGTANVHSEMSMSMNAEGQKQSVAMKMDVNFTLKAK